MKLAGPGDVEVGLHIYAHCQRGNPEGVTVLAINLEETTAQLALPGSVDLYALTAPQLQSRTVLLNGESLVIGGDDSLPSITPKRVQGNGVKLAPTSVNFIVLSDAGNPACSN